MQRSIFQRGLWLFFAAWLLTGCAGLAITPTPRAVIIAVVPASPITTPTVSPRPLPLAGALPEDTDVTPTVTPTVEITTTTVETSIVTPTVEITSTTAVPTVTFTPEPTLTPESTITPTQAAPTPAPTSTPIALSPLKAVNVQFRPFPNGYTFANYGGVTPTDFTITDTRRMFGDGDVCLINAGECVPRQEYLEFVDYVNRYMQYGHCDGITLTTLRFFLSKDLTTNFGRNARNASSLPLSTARRQIAYFWALQVPDPVALAQYESALKTPVEILQRLITALSSPARDMTSILVYNATRTAGHSMTPYAIESKGNGIWWVRVYDSNYPRNTGRYIIISTRTNTWSYDHGGRLGVWRGNAESHTLGAVPMSVYDQPPTCHLCWRGGAANQAGNLLVSSDVNSQLLVTNAEGDRLGVIDDQTYEEIPNAYRALLPGGLGLRDVAVFHLPITDTYVYSLSLPLSSTIELSQSVAASIQEFGPGFAVTVNDITLTDTQTSQLTVRNDGRQLAYRSGPTDRDNFKLVVETPTESKQFTVGGATVGAGRTLTLTLDDQQGRFIANNSQNISSAYDLSFTRVTSSGVQSFITSGIVITATDTQSIDYGGWSGTGPITLTIDVGSRGVQTETLPLYSLPIKVYIPWVANQ